VSEVRDCINCEKSLAVYCGKCVHAEREELNRLRRLTPTGTYTLNIAHDEELERMRVALRAAEKRELEALAGLDEERANVEMLVDCVETLRKAWKSASDKAQQLNERLNMSKPESDE